METANNFSLISNINTQNIPGQNFYNSNVFHPQTPRPVPVGGVGNPKLKDSHFENNEKANFYPHLKYATNSKINDQQLETPETVRKFLSENRSTGKSTTSEPLLKSLYQGKMNVNIYLIFQVKQNKVYCFKLNYTGCPTKNYTWGFQNIPDFYS